MSEHVGHKHASDCSHLHRQIVSAQPIPFLPPVEFGVNPCAEPYLLESDMFAPSLAPHKEKETLTERFANAIRHVWQFLLHGPRGLHEADGAAHNADDDFAH